MSSNAPLITKEILVAGSLAVLAGYMIKRLTQRPYPPLPPGPKSLPIIGHLLSMPRTAEHVAYANMSKELNSAFVVYHNLAVSYRSWQTAGDVIALTILGQTILVLNSTTAVAELMDKKSSVYSGRARIPVVCDKDLWVFDRNCMVIKVFDRFFSNSMDWGGSIVFLSGERWKRGRRMLHDSLSKSAMPRHHPSQEKRVQLFLSRLLNVSCTFETLVDEWYL